MWLIHVRYVHLLGVYGLLGFVWSVDGCLMVTMRHWVASGKFRGALPGVLKASSQL
jgi:hypothetical protein